VAALLVAFVIGLALLPFVYLERSRRRWQVAIRSEGCRGVGTVVAVSALITNGTRRSRLWSELVYDYLPSDAEAPIRITVHARTRDIIRADCSVGQSLPIHYRQHLTSESVPDGLDCRPAGI
jgi:hypothetical protein